MSKASYRALLFAGLLGVLLLGSMLFPFDGLLRSEEERVLEARALVAQWQLREAEAVLEPLFRAAKPGAEATALYADVLLKRGHLKQARALFSVPIDSLYTFDALAILALTHFYLGHPDSSSAVARHLMARARAHQDTLRLGQAFHLLGRIDFNRAQYDSAQARQRHSLALARQVGALSLEADALRQLGVLAWYRAQHDSALTAFYEPALALYRQTGDKAGEATTLSNIGLLYIEWQDWETNIGYQLRAFGIRNRIGDQVGLADSYYFLTTLPHWNTNQRRPFAHTYLLKSYALSTQIGYAWGQEVAAAALRNAMAKDPLLLEQLGYWRDAVPAHSQESQLLTWAFEAREQAKAGNLAEAAQQFEHLIHVVDSLGYNIGKPGYLGMYGYTLTELGAYAEAEQAFRRARALATGEHHRRTPVLSDLGLARLYLKTGRSQQAEALLTPLITFYDSLYIEKIQVADARVAFENAAATVHRLRAYMYSLLVETLSQRKASGLFTHIERERTLPFWGGQEVAREPGDQTDTQQAFDQLIWLLETYDAHPERFDDTQPLLDALGATYQALLTQQDVLAHTVATTRLPPSTSLGALQTSLGADEVLLTYFIGTDLPPFAPMPPSVFVARHDTTAFIPLATTEAELNALVDVYRRALMLGKSSPDDDLWHGPAHTLYSLLLAPLVEQGMLTPGDHLIISPHRTLHLLPFHALTSTAPPHDPHFLIEEHLVSYTPSATALVEARKQVPRPLRTLMAIAPEGERLPYAQAEIEQIPDGLFAATTVLTQTEATADAIREALGAYDGIHVAAHARMNPRHPLYSSLQGADRPLALHEILRERLKARLVVLSACETGLGIGALGTVPAAEDLVSFPRAFMTAGAASVVASLWLVEDEATASLMKQFYTAQQDPTGQSPSLVYALNHAQRQALAQAPRPTSYAHPFFWAGFYLIGDSR